MNARLACSSTRNSIRPPDLLDGLRDIHGHGARLKFGMRPGPRTRPGGQPCPE